MTKNSQKRKQRDIEKAAIAIKCARMTGVTVRQVRRVMTGDQKNDVIISVFMQLQEMTDEAEKMVKQQVIDTPIFY